MIGGSVTHDSLRQLDEHLNAHILGAGSEAQTRAAWNRKVQIKRWLGTLEPADIDAAAARTLGVLREETVA